IGTGIRWSVDQLDRHLVADPLVGGANSTAGARTLHRAVRDLGDTADESRVRERIELHHSRVADLDARYIGLVDLHLRFEDAHVADRQHGGGVLVESTLDGGLALLHVETRHPAAHWSGDGRLAQERLRVP